MTIIAGFRCEDGIVLCADSQETLGTAKRSVPKLRFEPRNPITGIEDNFSNLAAAFCGAGDGPFIDKLVEESWKAAKNGLSLDEVCASIEATIKNTYREFGEIYQRGECPEVQLIYGAKMNGESRLFSAMGPIVVEKFEFDTGGVGHYMADFLASKLHDNELTVRQVTILAAYVLMEATEHVDGCGGDNQIAVLRNSESSGTVSETKLYDVRDLIKFADWAAGAIVLAISDMDKDDMELKDEVERELQLLQTTRDHIRHQQRNKYAPEYLKTLDYLGLPIKQSISQTSKLEP
ncbi:MAG: hypothetical protein WAQ52_15770 [Terriglobales bacterium]